MIPTLPQKAGLKIGGIDKPIDVAGMEIGHLIHLLKKGNVNAIWSVMSPQVISSLIGNPFHSDLKDLRAVVRKNLSSVTYHSIRGMAMSQMSDAVKRSHVRPPDKSYATALRTINFGMRMLTADILDNAIDLETPQLTASMVLRAIKDLDEAFENSILPEAVAEKPFDDYLYYLRLKVMREDARYFAIKGGAKGWSPR
jgi:hypothetical protein